uniref:Uncharacterized protein n=1 Tax=Arundo donax TaxID=35708 RepID=A0A0A9BEE0_ARUDO
MGVRQPMIVAATSIATTTASKVAACMHGSVAALQRTASYLSSCINSWAIVLTEVKFGADHACI